MFIIYDYHIIIKKKILEWFNSINNWNLFKLTLKIEHNSISWKFIYFWYKYLLRKFNNIFQDIISLKDIKFIIINYNFYLNDILHIKYKFYLFWNVKWFIKLII